MFLESERKKVKSLSRVQLWDPVDCSLPGSSVHGILQARILEWVAISFSRASSQPRDRTRVSCVGGRCFNLWATKDMFLESQINTCLVNVLLYKDWIPVSFDETSEPRKGANPQSGVCGTLTVTGHVLCLLRRAWLLATLWITACQAPLSLGSSRQEYWGGFHARQGILPTQGPNTPLLRLQHWQVSSF